MYHLLAILETEKTPRHHGRLHLEPHPPYRPRNLEPCSLVYWSHKAFSSSPPSSPSSAVSVARFPMVAGTMVCARDPLSFLHIIRQTKNPSQQLFIQVLAHLQFSVDRRVIPSIKACFQLRLHARLKFLSVPAGRSYYSASYQSPGIICWT